MLSEKLWKSSPFLFLKVAGFCWTWTKSDICWKIVFEGLINMCDCIFLPFRIEPILALHVPDMVDSTTDRLFWFDVVCERDVICSRLSWDLCIHIIIQAKNFPPTWGYRESEALTINYWLTEKLWLFQLN